MCLRTRKVCFSLTDTIGGSRYTQGYQGGRTSAYYNVAPSPSPHARLVLLVLLVYLDLRDGCLQGPGCVPLDELFLTAPTGGRPGDPRRLALRKEIAFRSRKQRTCAYASLKVPHPLFFDEFRSRLSTASRMRSF